MKSIFTNIVKEASKEYEGLPNYDEIVQEHCEKLEQFFEKMYCEQRKRETKSTPVQICTQDQNISDDILKMLGGEYIHVGTLEQKIKDLEEKQAEMESKLVVTYPKKTTIQLNGELAYKIDGMKKTKDSGRKETYSEVLSGVIEQAEKVPELEKRIQELEDENEKLKNYCREC